MKFKLATSAAIMIILSVSLSFGTDTPGERRRSGSGVSSTQESKVKQMKDILFKLVRQDEYLDEAIETLDTANPKFTAHDISALSLRLKLIKGNLDNVAALNKTQFAEVQPGLNLSSYTKTILSYSAKMNTKVSRVGLLTRNLSAKNKKAAMRDAVSAKKGRPDDSAGGRGNRNAVSPVANPQERVPHRHARGRRVRGKSITRLLDEQQAFKQLSFDVKNLKASSAGLTATSKWLYIVSR